MGNPEVIIRDVWANNLEEVNKIFLFVINQSSIFYQFCCSSFLQEFARIRDLIVEYPFVAMDTEFPGVVATPLGQFKSKEDFNYQQVIRCLYFCYCSLKVFCRCNHWFFVCRFWSVL